MVNGEGWPVVSANEQLHHIILSCICCLTLSKYSIRSCRAETDTSKKGLRDYSHPKGYHQKYAGFAAGQTRHDKELLEQVIDCTISSCDKRCQPTT